MRGVVVGRQHGAPIELLQGMRASTMALEVAHSLWWSPQLCPGDQPWQSGMLASKGCGQAWVWVEGT